MALGYIKITTPLSKVRSDNCTVFSSSVTSVAVTELVLSPTFKTVVVLVDGEGGDAAALADAGLLVLVRVAGGLDLVVAGAYTYDPNHHMRREMDATINVLQYIAGWLSTFRRGYAMIKTTP